eukprot:364209-Chlamydomonas_euryale.AAC.15
MPFPDALSPGLLNRLPSYARTSKGPSMPCPPACSTDCLLTHAHQKDPRCPVPLPAQPIAFFPAPC